MLKLIALAVILVLGGLRVSGGLGARATPVNPQPAAQTTVAAAPGDRMIEITEADLTTELNQQLVGQALGSMPFGSATMQRVEAQLRDGALRADGDAQVGSTSVPVTMTARIHADAGRAVVTIDDLRAAGLPLPASARGPVEAAIQAQLDVQVHRLNVRVKSVTIADGKLRLIGSPA